MKIYNKPHLSALVILLAFCTLHNMASAMQHSKNTDSPRRRRGATIYAKEISEATAALAKFQELAIQQSNGIFHGLELIEYEQEPSTQKHLANQNSILDWETCSFEEISSLFTQTKLNKEQHVSLCLPKLITSLRRITSDNEADIVTHLSAFMAELSEIKSIDFSYNIEMSPDNIDSIAPIYLKAIWSNLRLHCTKLETIILDGNNIASLYKDDTYLIIFSNINRIKTLKTLSLKKCNLTSCQNIPTKQENMLRVYVNTIFDYCQNIKILFLQGNYLSQLFNKNTTALNLAYLGNLKKIERMYIDATMELDWNKLNDVLAHYNKSSLIEKTPLWGDGKEPEYDHNNTWIQFSKI